MNDKEIGAKIRSIRLSLGLTQAEVAERVGIQQESFRKFETGETHIINPHLEDITKALDTDIPELFMCYDFDKERRLLEEQFNARFDRAVLEQDRMRDKYEQMLRDKDRIISLMQDVIDSLRKEKAESNKK